MSDFPISPLFTPPLAFDAPRAERTLADLKAQGFVSDAATTALLNGVFGNAPYLARLALREPETLAATLTQGAEAVVAAAVMQALGAGAAANEAEAMTVLRVAKRRAALAIALADISGAWDLETVTQALTQFADSSVKGALRFLLAQMAASQGATERNGAVLEAETGLVVLAMGKLLQNRPKPIDPA